MVQIRPVLQTSFSTGWPMSSRQICSKVVLAGIATLAIFLFFSLCFSDIFTPHSLKQPLQKWLKATARSKFKIEQHYACACCVSIYHIIESD
ncbi:hypothetical protein T4C_2311 [Trichinella pseudospiralis]|uniref:Uncharacterized protein n=1 Tax=Trichinella pseudospiralis TaxID=6337 RepID=A0A0V1K447_TRIPS|nr:hypothetical protein T4C_2311 [Trichinella pseudospiralis]